MRLTLKLSPSSSTVNVPQGRRSNLGELSFGSDKLCSLLVQVNSNQRFSGTEPLIFLRVVLPV